MKKENNQVDGEQDKKICRELFAKDKQERIALWMITSAIEALAERIHKNAVDKGFYANFDIVNPALEKASRIALMHSELSECLEAVRCDELLLDAHCPGFTNETIELADLVIRALDYAEAFKLPLAEAIIAKHEYNKSRPMMHGGKKF